MASKIQSHHVYVAITTYEMKGQRYDEVDVMTAYDDRAKHFYVNLHPGWKTDYGHGCFLYGGDDPLTASKWVKVKDSPKNSQKFINEAGGALEMAKDAIAWLFDKRDWQRLYVAVRNIALNGYTEKYRQQMEQLMNNTNNQNSEDNTMRLNMNANKSENQNVAMEPQVNNNPIEDAQAVEVTTEADVQEVNDIVPKVTPKKDSNREPKEKPAVTIPMGQHGSIVIAGVGGTKADVREKKEDVPQTSAISHQPSVKVQDSVPQGKLQYVTFGTYKTKKSADAPIITGFGGEDDPRWKKLFDAKPKWVSAGFRRDLEGNRTYHLLFGTKYMAVAKALCEAYNTTDRKAWEQAEQACADNYSGIVAGYKAEKEARKAEREAAKAAKAAEKPAAQTSTEKSYTLDEVAAMLGKLLPDGASKVDDIKKLLKAA